MEEKRGKEDEGDRVRTTDAQWVGRRGHRQGLRDSRLGWWVRSLGDGGNVERRVSARVNWEGEA